MTYVLLTRDSERRPKAHAVNSLTLARRKAKRHAKENPSSGVIVYKLGGPKRISATDTHGGTYTVPVSESPVFIIEPTKKGG